MLCPQRFIALAVVLLATLLSVGFVHGLRTDRWVSRDSSQELLELEKVPLIVGAWEGKTVDKNTKEEQILTDANNYLTRSYVNHIDGTVASVMITRGRPGPLVIKHLPTECYPGAGYELVGQPKHFFSESSDPKKPDEFWVATFKKTTDDAPICLRVYWSWSGTGQWQTPDRPRMTFARYSILYKLYVIRPMLNEDEALEGAPVHDLIKELTSAMRSSIFTSVRQ